MKKVFLVMTLVIAAVGAVLYILNPPGIYQLNDKTAKFVPLQAIPEGLVSLKAADCGVCHQQIFREWQTSLHARAFEDPFFRAYHRKDEGDPTCLKCHTPLLNQSPVILHSESGNYDDLEATPNPDFDVELQQEGVTCSACHVRDGIIYGPYPRQVMNAPHPVAYDEKFLSEALCNQCHEVPSKDFSLMNEGICSTGMEFAEGPWAEKGYICQDCHMPAIERPLVQGFPPRPGRRHLWPGAYSSEQLRKVFAFSAQRDGNQLVITIINSGAGHKAPSGDPDRFIKLDFYWQDGSANRTPLTSVEFKRQVIWQPIMFVWSDNRLAAGDSLQLTVPLPDGPGSLVVDGIYHVMTQAQLKRLQKHYGLQQAWDIRRPFFINQPISIDAQQAGL